MEENSNFFSTDFGDTTGNEAQTSITIDGEEITSPTITIADNGSRETVRITYQDENESEIFSLERPQAELNIFDPQYYLNSNPDVAEAIEGNDEGTGLVIQLLAAQLPNLTPGIPFSSIQSSGNNNITTNIVDADGNIINSESNNLNDSLLDYSASINHYVSNGALEGRDPSPLFDSEYYLEENPDVASALAGGAFSGDPLLHYVSSGAIEGRDPNAYFDSSYYTEQNPEVQEGYNPLEHYILLGSLSGADPSPNFDPDYYLSQNPDVANLGIDPLTHFLTFGQEEGRQPTA